MLCEYLWDERDGTLLVQVPQPEAGRPSGILVSADSADGGHFPLLGLPIAAWPQDGSPFQILVSLPGDLSWAAGPVSVTVDLFCVLDGRPECLSDRVALDRKAAPARANCTYWMATEFDSSGPVHVSATPGFWPPDSVVLCSRRIGHSVFPAERRRAAVEPDRVAVTLATEAYAAGQAHTIGLRGSDGARTTLSVKILSARTVCDLLQPKDASPGTASPLADPLGRFDLSRPDPQSGLRGQTDFAVHAGSLEPAATEALRHSLQFLDRLVIWAQTAVEFVLEQDGRTLMLPSPLVLVATGDGRLSPDHGKVQALLAAGLTSDTALPDPVDPDAAIAVPVVDRILQTVSVRIAGALPGAGVLRPAHATALKQNPSYFQALAWGLPDTLSSAAKADIRRRFAPLQGEPALLRDLCRVLALDAMVGDRSALPPLARERVEAWLTGAGGSARQAALTCVAALGWHGTTDLIAAGVRPDPYFMAEVDDGLRHTWARKARHLQVLVDLGFGEPLARFMLAESTDLPEVMDAFDRVWTDIADHVEAIQADLGYHPVIGLERLAGPAPRLPMARILVQALRHRLLAGLRGLFDEPVPERLAERLVQPMAAELDADFRKVLALTQREALKLPSFFVADQASSALRDGFMPSDEPSILADPRALATWLAPAMEDKPLVRAWKAELQAQMDRRAPREEGARPV